MKSISSFLTAKTLCFALFLGFFFSKQLAAQTTALMPFNNGPTTLTTSPSPFFYNFYDNGGPSNNYSSGSGANSVLTFAPSSNVKKIQAVFSSFQVEGTFDALFIYDGPTVNSPLIGSFSGSTLPSNMGAGIVQATQNNSSGALTFKFTSDVSVNLAGWAAVMTEVGEGGGGGCTAPTITSISSNTPICANQTLNLNVMASGTAPLSYSWAGTGTFSPSNTAQNPSVSGAATGNFSVTVSNGCGSASSSTAAVVNPTVQPTIYIYTNTPSICAGETAYFEAVCQYAGGSPVFQWKKNGINVGTNYYLYNDASIQDGDVITCQLTSSWPCAAPSVVLSAPLTMTVHPLPTASLAPFPTLCLNQYANGDIYELTGGSPAGGSWSNPLFYNGTSFFPAWAGLGSFPIGYNYTDGNGCSAPTVYQNLVIDDCGQPCTAMAQYWSWDCDFGYSFLAFPGFFNPNYSFQWKKNGIEISGETTHFFWANEVGSFTVVITDPDDCTAESPAQVVTQLPQAGAVSMEQLGTVCNADGPIPLVGYPAGGFFSGPGVVGDPFSGYFFDPSLVVAPAVCTIYYFNCDGEDFSEVTVDVCESCFAQATISHQVSLCSPYTDELTAAPNDAATYDYQWKKDGSPISGATAPVFDATMAGSYTVIITKKTNAACTHESVPYPMVIPPLITIEPYPTIPVCVNAAPFQLTYGHPSGGYYQNYNGGGGVLPDGQTFDPATAGVGAHGVLYINSASAPCIAVGFEITVNAAPTASISASAMSICSGQSPTLTASGGSTFLWNTGATTAQITVSPTTTTTYLVTVSNSNGCSGTASKTITVNPNPTASISATAMTICMGQSSTLTASGGTTFLWNTGATTAAITVSPSATTTYLVTVSNASGCSGTASKTITVNPNPTAAISATAMTICAGQSSTLTASGGSNYLWNTGATTTAITVSPSATTTYLVTVSNASGCSGTASKTISVFAYPTVTLAPFAAICNTAPPLTLTGGSPTGGVYSGTGVSGGVFNPSVAGVGTHVISYAVTNEGGCTATVTRSIVVNACNPCTIMTCPPNRNVPMTTDCKIQVPNLIPEVVLAGNCLNPITKTQSPAAGSLIPKQHNETQNVVITVTDASGGPLTCTVVLTAKDVTPPTISTSLVSFQADMNSACNITILSYLSFVNATDGCSAVTKTQSPLGTFPATHNQQFTITFTATDAAGNTATITRVLTAKDKTAPAITTCPANRNVPLNAQCKLLVPDMTGEMVATDCSIPPSGFKTQSPTAGTLLSSTNGQTHLVTMKATDAAGLTKICTVTLTGVGSGCASGGGGAGLVDHSSNEINPSANSSDKNVIEQKLDLQAMPNPFGDELTIAFDLETASQTRLVLMDLTGRFIFLEKQNSLVEGRQVFTWNTEDLPEGAYLVGLKVENEGWRYRKVMLVRR